MNSNRLKDLIHNQQTHISFEEYRIRYATERFLKRLQESEYKDKLILKGGFLLGTIFKIDQRTTKDLDTLITEMKADRVNVEQMLEGIESVDLDDGVKFELISLVDSQQERIYEGFKAKIKMHFIGERTNINFDLDLGVGDAVTPKPQRIKIPVLFKEKNVNAEEIELLAYPLETILAEKTEIILDLGTKSSRMKDFYDIHLLLNEPSLPAIDSLYEAFKNTWTFRHERLQIDEERFQDWYYTLDEIVEDEIMNEVSWKNYVKDRDYAKALKLSDIVSQFKLYMQNLEEFHNLSK